MASHVRSSKRALSDQDLAELGREWRQARADAKVAEEYVAELQGDILAELNARQVKAVDVFGVRLVRRSRIVRKVDVALLKEVIGRTLFGRVTTTTLDTAQWNAAISRGEITYAQVDAVETEAESSPWIDVSEVA